MMIDTTESLLNGERPKARRKRRQTAHGME